MDYRSKLHFAWSDVSSEAKPRFTGHLRIPSLLCSDTPTRLATTIAWSVEAVDRRHPLARRASSWGASDL